MTGSMNAKLLLLAAPFSAAAAILSRRNALRSYGAVSLAPQAVQAAPRPDWESYAVRGDSATMIPSVAAIKADGLVDALSTKRAVFLGEHHDAAADHALQAEVISRLRRKVGTRPMAVGLEMVQRRFQPQLDLYTAGRLTEAELRKAVDWDRRWGWPFETYVPVLKAAKRARASLLALNADDEDAAPVSAGGLAALAPDARRRYVSDPKASEAFARTVAFKSYVGYTIRPSYAAHVALGILPATDPSACVGNDGACTTTFKNFLARRILWDEALSKACADWCRDHENGLCVAIVGADHVKYGCGAPARLARSLPNGLGDLATVLLNERPADTKGDAVGGVERGAAPFAFDSFAADRSVPRGADGLVGFRNYVLQLRFAPNPEVDDWVGNERDRGRGPELVAEASAARQTVAGSAVLPLADFLLFSEA